MSDASNTHILDAMEPANLLHGSSTHSATVRKSFNPQSYTSGSSSVTPPRASESLHPRQTQQEEYPSLAADPYPGVVQRFGTKLIATNVFAIVALLGSISALILLWFGGETNENWHKVILSESLGQVITLSTIAIRLAVSIQAATAVSMLASVSLELSNKTQNGVVLQQIASYSLMRHSNTGPITSFWPFWKNLEWRKSVLAFLIVTSLAVSSLVSQFTSTLLLWDVRTIFVRGFPSTNETRIGFSLQDYIHNVPVSISKRQDYLGSQPRGFVPFAEWTEKPSSLPDSIVDTGPSSRALLPLDAQHSPIVEYEGTAAVFDSRVVCVRPEISDATLRLGLTSSGSLYLSVSVSPGRIPEALADILRYNGTAYHLYCELAAEVSDSDTSYEKEGQSSNSIVMCGLPRSYGGLVNQFDPTNNITIQNRLLLLNATESGIQTLHWIGSHAGGTTHWEVELGRAFLFTKSSGLKNIMRRLDQDKDTDLTISAHSRGVWLEFTAESSPNSSISASLCFDSMYQFSWSPRLYHPQDFSIKAWNKKLDKFNDPTPIWIPDTKRFDTTELRRYLGAEGSPSIDRSLFELDISPIRSEVKRYSEQWNADSNLTGTGWSSFNVSIPSSYNVESTASDFLSSLVWLPMGYNDDSNPSCGLSLGKYDLDIRWENLLEDVLNDTNNPALAWQALSTAVMSAAYYDWLNLFTRKQRVSTTSIVSTQAPSSFNGFSIVTANLLVHLVLFATATTWFIKTTRHSRLNSAWQAVSQLVGPETEGLLERATMADDSDVGDWIRASGRENMRFGMQKTPGMEQVCVVPVDHETGGSEDEDEQQSVDGIELSIRKRIVRRSTGPRSTLV